jgi:hypothetical protein
MWIGTFNGMIHFLDKALVYDSFRDCAFRFQRCDALKGYARAELKQLPAWSIIAIQLHRISSGSVWASLHGFPTLSLPLSLRKLITTSMWGLFLHSLRHHETTLEVSTTSAASAPSAPALLAVPVTPKAATALVAIPIVTLALFLFSLHHFTLPL